MIPSGKIQTDYQKIEGHLSSLWTCNLVNHKKLHRLIIVKAVVICIFVYGHFFSGCAGLGKRLEPPKINITNIQFKEVKDLESVFQIELRVFNTNDIPITIKGIDCELDINDKRFALGVSNDETVIPSFGTEKIPILVYSSVIDIFRGVIGFQGKDKIKYKIKGKVRLDTGSLAPSTVPFVSEGELSFKNILNKRR